MVINLSSETIQTVHSSLKAVKTDLKRQHDKATSNNKKEIIQSQLEDVEDALAVFDELMDSIWTYGEYLSGRTFILPLIFFIYGILIFENKEFLHLDAEKTNF